MFILFMGKYIFILGRDPELSILEIKSYFEARNIKYKIIESTKEILLLELPNLDFKKVIKDLGGVIKIGKIGFKTFYDGSKNKILYGVNEYNSKLNINFKEKFKLEGIKAYLNAKGKISPSKSLKLDVEFLIYKNNIAKIIAFFNPKEYKDRDKRPFLDPLRVSSIRLSKILINLSGAKEGDLLLDPFCGLGTILQEALLMGIKVVGIEKDENTVRMCKKNLEWLNKDGWKITRGDSRALSKYVKSADCVATEPYLGPFLKKLPDEREAKKTISLLESLYLAIFRELAKVVKGKVAIIIPKFRTRSRKELKINFVKILENTGFKTVSGYPIKYEESSLIKREIWVVKRKV